MSLYISSSNGLWVAGSSKINNLRPCTTISWIYLETPLAANTYIYYKGPPTATSEHYLRFTAPTKTFQIFRDFGTTNATGRSTGSAYEVTSGEWWCFATILTAANVPQVFLGKLNQPMAEPPYHVQTTGVGTLGDDSSTGLYIGTTANVATGASQLGRFIRMSHGAIFNRALSLSELIQWQYNPAPLSGCVGFWQMGKTGAGTTNTQPDYSGNGSNAILTGSSLPLAPPIPLGYPLFR